MGNTTSALTVASADTSIHGLYAFVPKGPQVAGTTLLGDRSSRSVFRFTNGTKSDLFNVNVEGGDFQSAIYNTLDSQQNFVFSKTGDVSSDQDRLLCRGDTRSRTIQCTSKVGGKTLNSFYTCSKGVGAAVQIGVSVPSGCSSLNLVFTPNATRT